jgi:hypothetical protein
MDSFLEEIKGCGHAHLNESLDTDKQQPSCSGESVWKDSEKCVDSAGHTLAAMLMFSRRIFHIRPRRSARMPSNGLHCTDRS